MIEAGQFWKVNGITYRVDSLESEATLNEADRDASVNAELDAQIAGLHPARLVYSLLPELYKPRSMTVDLRWFERSDVKQVDL
jgi:hypothetical protein